eukprot:scaffold298795_cov51-Attheya_sp.AAC.1
MYRIQEEGNESEREGLTSEEEEEESSDEEEEVGKGFISSSPFELTQLVLVNKFSPEFLQQTPSITTPPVYAAAPVCNPQIELLEAEVIRLKSELEKWKKKKKKNPSQGTQTNQETVPKEKKKRRKEKQKRQLMRI